MSKMPVQFFGGPLDGETQSFEYQIFAYKTDRSVIGLKIQLESRIYDGDNMSVMQHGYYQVTGFINDDLARATWQGEL